MQKFRQRQLFLSTIFCLLLSSCLRPEGDFEDYKPPPSPDYSLESCWAALPARKDSADVVPPGSGLTDNQANARADVFFIHPTTYYKSNSWNANVNDGGLNKFTDKTTIKTQASVFNGSCRVYAPRYRQATLYSFFDRAGNGQKAMDLAYEDVKKSFKYYLENYNHGRPIIIASHSQGTCHAIQLMKDFFSDTVLKKQLVAAYLIGGPVKKNFLKNIPGCDSASQCGCYVAWNTRKWKEEAFKARGQDAYGFPGGGFENLECTNPLTWKRDTFYASSALNKGSVGVGFKGVDRQIADAKCTPQGTLWVHDPSKSGYPNIFSYHILDYGLFWVNIRENVKLKVEKYFQASP